MNIASYIDHTILKSTTSIQDIEKLCQEATQYQFAAVCVPPFFIADAKNLVAGTLVKVATVIGFPMGYSSTVSKLHEIEEAIKAGADELDMVINIAAVKSQQWELVDREVALCVEAIHAHKKSMKLIVESGELTDEELIRSCKTVTDNGVDFIKTSTGFSTTGATVHAVSIMRKHISPTTEIKASGGIRDFKFAQELIAAGATRIGCSASIAIVAASAEKNV